MNTAKNCHYVLPALCYIPALCYKYNPGDGGSHVKPHT